MNRPKSGSFVLFSGVAGVRACGHDHDDDEHHGRSSRADDLHRLEKGAPVVLDADQKQDTRDDADRAQRNLQIQKPRLTVQEQSVDRTALPCSCFAVRHRHPVRIEIQIQHDAVDDIQKNRTDSQQHADTSFTEKEADRSASFDD